MRRRVNLKGVDVVGTGKVAMGCGNNLFIKRRMWELEAI